MLHNLFYTDSTTEYPLSFLSGKRRKEHDSQYLKASTLDPQGLYIRNTSCAGSHLLWFRMDDVYVSPVHESVVLDDMAYCLFYVRLQSAPPRSSPSTSSKTAILSLKGTKRPADIVADGPLGPRPRIIPASQQSDRTTSLAGTLLQAPKTSLGPVDNRRGRGASAQDVAAEDAAGEKCCIAHCTDLITIVV